MSTDPNAGSPPDPSTSGKDGNETDLPFLDLNTPESPKKKARKAGVAPNPVSQTETTGVEKPPRKLKNKRVEIYLSLDAVLEEIIDEFSKTYNKTLTKTELLSAGFSVAKIKTFLKVVVDSLTPVWQRPKEKEKMAKKLESLALAEAIKRGVEKLRLPAWVGEGRASQSLSLLLGMMVADSSLLDHELVLTSKEIRRHFWIRPFFGINPIGYTLSRNFLVDEEQGVEVIVLEGLRAILRPDLVRPAFRDFITEQLIIVRELVEKNRLAEAKRIRTSESDRFREVRRLLEADHYAGTSPDELRASAQAEVEARYQEEAKNKTERARPRSSRRRRLRWEENAPERLGMSCMV